MYSLCKWPTDFYLKTTTKSRKGYIKHNLDQSNPNKEQIERQKNNCMTDRVVKILNTVFRCKYFNLIANLFYYGPEKKHIFRNFHILPCKFNI